MKVNVPIDFYSIIKVHKGFSAYGNLILPYKTSIERKMERGSPYLTVYIKCHNFFNQFTFDTSTDEFVNVN